ncbi:MAG TPA: ABC transporter substrate-binding protein [Candidatus Saccharimonadales bacterium]|nr:ABC transporter substrate-binding protein [Candidatus Saccharimonadales bacterium]
MHQYARLSLLSIVLTAIAITINHFFTLGPKALGLGTVLIGLSALTLWWFKKTNKSVAFAAYMLVNVWVILGFGLMKALKDIVLPLFVGPLLASASDDFAKPVIGNALFTLSGLMMFIGSLFVAYFAFRLFMAKHKKSNKPAAVFRRNVWFGGALLLAVLAVGGMYAGNARDAWEEPKDGVVKIGILAPTTGPYSKLGGSFVKAVEVAQADLKDTKYRYELVVRDTGEDPAKAKEVIRKTIEEDKVDAIVGAVSLIGEVTQPMANKARIPHLCICTVESIGDGKYNFTNIPSPEAEAVLWAQEAKRRGIKTLAIVNQDYPSINNHVKALKAEAARQGLQVVYEQKFKEDQKDFTDIIAAARATKPDIYYTEALNPSLDIMARQFVDANIRNISAVVAPSLSDRQDLFEGTWYTDSNLVDFGFKKRFEEKYPDTEFAVHMMPYAYDNINLIVQAYESGKNPAAYLRGLRSYEGTAGKVTKARGDGHFRSTPAVWVIRNGEPILGRQ